MTLIKQTLKKVIFAPLALTLMVGGIGSAVLVLSPTATAQTSTAKAVVDQAKLDGFVGERIDGYLGLVTGYASAEVQAAVNEINIRRKSVYTNLARSQNVSVDVVAALSGEKLVAKAAPGTNVMDANGVWRKLK
jgi:uncharacterized protein YdbL (DUF1318 family)